MNIPSRLGTGIGDHPTPFNATRSIFNRAIAVINSWVVADMKWTTCFHVEESDPKRCKTGWG